MVNTPEADLIKAYAKSNGFEIRDWYEDEENGVTAVIGRFRVIEDDEDRGFYADDEGKIEACVVGSVEYRNQRVALTFIPDGYDGGEEVYDLDILEEI